MKRKSVYTRLKQILLDDFAADERLLTPTATLRGTLMMDSLDIVDLIFFVRREFGIDAAMEDFLNIHALEGLAAFIERRVSLSSGAPELAGRQKLDLSPTDVSTMFRLISTSSP